MILERLRDFHERIEDELIPSYHKEKGCRWILDIDEEGTFRGFVETGRTKRKATNYVAPHMRRSGRTPPPYLLVDKPAYVLGLPRNEKEKWKKKAAQRHENYVALAEECADAVDHPALKAYLTFLDAHVDDALADPHTEDMKKGDLIIPRVDGTLLTQIPEVQQFWIQRQDAEAAEKSTLTTECTVCGEKRPVIRTEPVELTLGPDRVNVITGNEKAFLSHDLEQSEISPVCQPCARSYGEALRYLLEKDRHHLRLADVTWVYWTDRETDFDPMTSIAEANPRDVETLLEAAYGASKPGEVETARFYAAALTSNISRLAVRSWVTSTVEEVQHNVSQYFERMRLVGRDGPRYHGLYALAGSTVRDLDDLPPQTNETILSHALTGRRLPKSLMHQATQRARVEGSVTHPRAALLKLVLLSNQPDNADPMVYESLNPNHDNPAYHCGRLLAVLENIQREAVNPNTTLVDRYYGTASTAPASVFGNLMRSAQSHLSKLRRDSEKGGLGVYFQKQLGEIMIELDERGGFPNTLSAQDQSLFALGYYQQRHRTGESSDDDASDTPEPAKAAA
ncbi:MAG: type I-C CRISPR-associated protein Cas8c/Csd1 [Salinibacter sp.]|uniref:type I-C CRISPR-associated protein Cas8c/Csd1 n=1 Tax=Salinibacter sp. TaxID=2065818 RepID=UPI0035D4E33E